MRGIVLYWAMVMLTLGTVGCGGNNPTGDTAISDNDSNADGVAADGQALDAAQGDGHTRSQPDLMGDTESIGGDFLDPCDENEDCQSDFCVPTSGGMQCARPCVPECPGDWTCTESWGEEDVSFICVPVFVNLCRRCALTADCTEALGDVSLGSRCIAYPGKGWFCGHDCSTSSCPSGYTCNDSPDPRGEVTAQCVADSGECT